MKRATMFCRPLQSAFAAARSTPAPAARVGEDEFLVVIPGTEDSIDSVEIARRLGGAISKPIYVGSTRITVSTCIGICSYPQDGATADILERNADFAMSRAKSTGESYCVFSSAMRTEANEAMEIEEALGVALEKNYLRLVYQPLYASDGSLTGFEALLRFRHQRLGEISPARFIPVAEDTRLIVPIGNWVLREACRQLKEWNDNGLPHVRMAVNISALQFARDDFADSVARTFSTCGVDPEDLILELTESVVMEDYGVGGEPDESAAPVRRAHRHGRFRHRVLLAQLHSPHSGGHHQGRPIICGSPDGTGSTRRSWKP